jgi:hypothetical protein
MSDKSTIELICDQIQGLFEAHAWQSLNSPEIYQGLSIWDPDNQNLPLITILPRMARVETNRYGECDCSQSVEITALIPLAVGASAMIGQAVVAEIIKAVFAPRQHDWFGFPDEMHGIKLTEAGIIQYPSEMNPQMVSAGVTLEINYEMELHHAPLEE